MAKLKTSSAPAQASGPRDLLKLPLPMGSLTEKENKKNMLCNLYEINFWFGKIVFQAHHVLSYRKLYTVIYCTFIFSPARLAETNNRRQSWQTGGGDVSHGRGAL